MVRQGETRPWVAPNQLVGFPRQGAAEVVATFGRRGWPDRALKPAVLQLGQQLRRDELLLVLADGWVDRELGPIRLLARGLFALTDDRVLVLLGEAPVHELSLRTVHRVDRGPSIVRQKVTTFGSLTFHAADKAARFHYNERDSLGRTVAELADHGAPLLGEVGDDAPAPRLTVEGATALVAKGISKLRQPQRSLADQLQELADLHATKAIDDDEYARLRNQLTGGGGSG